MSKKLEMFTDGACSGNPGSSGIGVVIKHHGKIIKEISKSIGQATNNIAEYMALIYGLQEGLILRAEKVTVYTDSELLYNQVRGHFKVKDEKIIPLHAQIKHLLGGFKYFEIKFVTRDKNKEADRLAKKALSTDRQNLKEEQAKVVAFPS